MGKPTLVRSRTRDGDGLPHHWINAFKHAEKLVHLYAIQRPPSVKQIESVSVSRTLAVVRKSCCFRSETAWRFGEQILRIQIQMAVVSGELWICAGRIAALSINDRVYGFAAAQDIAQMQNNSCFARARRKSANGPLWAQERSCGVAEILL